MVNDGEFIGVTNDESGTKTRPIDDDRVKMMCYNLLGVGRIDGNGMSQINNDLGKINEKVKPNMLVND